MAPGQVPTGVVDFGFSRPREGACGQLTDALCGPIFAA